MPHPTPAQIAYGSATVVSTTLLMLLFVPEASPPVASLMATGGLALGVLVAVLLRPRQAPSRGPSVLVARSTGSTPADAPYQVAPGPPPRTAERPEVKV
jgi:hypothetical protein